MPSGRNRSWRIIKVSSKRYFKGGELILFTAFFVFAVFLTALIGGIYADYLWFFFINMYICINSNNISL